MILIIFVLSKENLKGAPGRGIAGKFPHGKIAVEKAIISEGYMLSTWA